jgi:hypothetical protein
MSKLTLKIICVLLFGAAISGCGSIKQESAMEWMARQPQYIDP